MPQEGKDCIGKKVSHPEIDGRLEGPLKNAELLKSDTKIIARPGNVAERWTVTQGAPFTRLQMNASSLFELNR